MTELVARVPVDPRLLFGLLVLVMLALAAGHLFLIQGLTSVVLGLPVWLWVHLAVVGILLGLAWLATDVAVTGRT